MKYGALISIISMSIAFGTAGRAQAPFSCGQAFGTLSQGANPDRELRAWIVFMTRRFAMDNAKHFWEKVSASDFPCADLSCVSDEEIVIAVAQQCMRKPNETLELAAQGGGFVTFLQTFRRRGQ